MPLALDRTQHISSFHDGSAVHMGYTKRHRSRKHSASQSFTLYALDEGGTLWPFFTFYRYLHRIVTYCMYSLQLLCHSYLDSGS